MRLTSHDLCCSVSGLVKNSKWIDIYCRWVKNVEGGYNLFLINLIDFSRYFQYLYIFYILIVVEKGGKGQRNRENDIYIHEDILFHTRFPLHREKTLQCAARNFTHFRRQLIERVSKWPSSTYVKRSGCDVQIPSKWRMSFYTLVEIPSSRDSRRYGLLPRLNMVIVSLPRWRDDEPNEDEGREYRRQTLVRRQMFGYSSSIHDFTEFFFFTFFINILSKFLRVKSQPMSLDWNDYWLTFDFNLEWEYSRFYQSVTFALIKSVYILRQLKSKCFTW